MRSSARWRRGWRPRPGLPFCRVAFGHGFRGKDKLRAIMIYSWVIAAFDFGRIMGARFYTVERCRRILEQWAAAGAAMRGCTPMVSLHAGLSSAGAAPDFNLPGVDGRALERDQCMGKAAAGDVHLQPLPYVSGGARPIVRDAKPQGPGHQLRGDHVQHVRDRLSGRLVRQHANGRRT